MTAALHELARLCAEGLLNSIPEGLGIAALAWLALRVTGKQNSGTRFAVWFCALLAVAALPFFHLLHPAAGSGITHVSGAEIVLPGRWAIVIGCAWMLVAFFAGAQIALALINVRRLRRTSAGLRLFDLDPGLRESIEQLQLGRPVEVRASTAVRVPTAIGFLKPTILIPEWALRELPAEELKIILLHEFAHVRRWDDWTNLTQKIVRAILFFHPAVWWIENRLSLEREMACDDAVLAETGNPRRYAACLVSLAEKTLLRRGIAMAQAAISRARETSLRLAQILDGNRPHATHVLRPAVGITSGLAAVCLGVLPFWPRMIAFETVPASATVAMQRAFANSPLRTPAAVVPAKFVGTQRSDRGADCREQTFKPVPAPVANGLHVVKERQQKQVQRDTMTRTTMAKPVPAPQWLLVMRTTQYDERGSAVASFTIWQVTFASAGGKDSREAVIVKLI